MSIYLPAFDRQNTPYNCGPAAAAMCVTRDWLGARTGSESAIRTQIDTAYSISSSTGTTHAQAIAAVATLYGTTLVYRYNFPFADFGPCLDAYSAIDGNENTGRGAMVSIGYAALHGTSFDHAPGFSGRHRVYVNERRYNDAKGRYEFLVFDPVANGPAWWPSSLLQAAMELVGTEASFTRNTTGPVKKILCTGTVLYAAPATTSSTKAITRGTLVRTNPIIPGGKWSTNCGVGEMSGSGWYEVTEVAGAALSAFWSDTPTTKAYVVRSRVVD